MKNHSKTKPKHRNPSQATDPQVVSYHEPQFAAVQAVQKYVRDCLKDATGFAAVQAVQKKLQETAAKAGAFAAVQAVQK